VHVEQSRPRQGQVHAVDRDEDPADRRPHDPAEHEPRQDRAQKHHERAGHGRRRSPAERVEPEDLLAERDLPLAQVGMDVRSDVPSLLSEQLLGVVQPACLVALAQQDAARLRVVELVEHELLGLGEVNEPQDRRERRHGDDHDDGTRHERGQRRHVGLSASR
jgi:hypothetical protein